MKYNWQQEDWPNFTYQIKDLEGKLLQIAEGNGILIGMVDNMSHENKEQIIIDMMVAEAIKTSEIEGEYLSKKDILSSIKNNLGIGSKRINVKDRKAADIGKLMVQTRRSYDEPLNEEMLFSWHAILFSNEPQMTTGTWRKHTEPMQVISGAAGKERVHFEAPPSSTVAKEMKRFIRWFNATAPNGKLEIKSAALRAAIAHLYFESIHPFEDGNGRIGRAIAEKALSQTNGIPIYYSISQAIEAEKNKYYKALESAQRQNEITGWLHYFVNMIAIAQAKAKSTIAFTLKKAAFFVKHKDDINTRQQKAITRMFDAGPQGFEGGMTTRKYVSLTKTSRATATRDLQQLEQIGAFVIVGAGRSTSYQLNI